MIEYKNGKYRSYRTKKEGDTSLAKTLASLKPDEQEALKILLGDMEKGQGGTGIFESMNRLDFKSEPVDLKTFIYDPYYLGNTCDVLFPKWFEALTELFEGEYNEAVFTGSLGAGKTFAASIGICYLLYQLSLMKNPQKSFGIASTSYIDIVAFSVTEDLAKKVAFDNIVGKIEASEYFQTNFPFETTKREIRFPNNIRVAPRATTDNAALGLNVMAALLDETDFMTAKKVKGSNTKMILSDQADRIYNSVKRRIKSRFQKQGKLPGVLFVVSSKNARDSFSERLIKSAMKESERTGSDSLFVRDFSTWEVQPAENFADVPRFWVLVGNDQFPSKIVKPEDLDKLRESLPEDCVLIDVPEDYRAEFERDLEGSIRDVAGISTTSVSPFIQRVEKIPEAVALYERSYPGAGHPFTVLEFVPGKPGEFMWDRMVQQTKERGFLGHWETRFRPKINPRAIRHVHIDPSTSGDATGVCVAHISGYKDVKRKAADGQEYQERAPVYTVDFILRIVPPIGDEIILGDVRQFIYELSAHGYVITTVTLDSWNCFTGDTKVKLLDGRSRTFEQLCEEYKDGQTFGVYSFNGKQIVPGVARAPRKSGHKAVVEVELDNGEKVRCTHDHLWMARDGSWKQASTLVPGDSLMPLYTRLSTKKETALEGYEQVYQPISESWDFTHRVVGRRIWGNIRGKTIHHNGPCVSGCCGRKKFCRLNNDPAHLMLLTHEEHHKMHGDLGKEHLLKAIATDWHGDPERRKMRAAQNAAILDEVRRRPEVRAKMNANLRNRVWPAGSELRREQTAGRARKNLDKKKAEHIKWLDITLEQILETASSEKLISIKAIARHFKCAPSVIGNRFKLTGMSVKDFLEKIGGWNLRAASNMIAPKNPNGARKVTNHKVVAVRDAGFSDIYDLTVDEHANFALDAGVFVHNSVDAIQTLTKKGYTSELLSVDRTLDPYETMKMALYEGRILMYQYEPLFRELRTIQKDLVRHKIDHPVNSSKDISDALAGCLFTLSQHTADEPLPIIRVDSTAPEDPWGMPQTDYISRGGSAANAPMWQDIMPPFMIGSSGGGWGNGDE